MNPKKLKMALKKRITGKLRKNTFFLYTNHRPHYTMGSKSYEDWKGADGKPTKLFDRYNGHCSF